MGIVRRRIVHAACRGGRPGARRNRLRQRTDLRRVILSQRQNTAIVFNPVETADNLKKYGGFIPGIRPGKNTADYLDYVLTRLTVIGAAYLSVVCLLPEILISQYAVPFYFGGTSLLIVVTVTMDTVAQIHSHLLAHQYEGLIKKAKLRGRRG